jgi:hypothetical protein
MLCNDENLARSKGSALDEISETRRVIFQFHRTEKTEWNIECLEDQAATARNLITY